MNITSLKHTVSNKNPIAFFHHASQMVRQNSPSNSIKAGSEMQLLVVAYLSL